MNKSKVTFFTFLAVFGAFLIIGASIAPFALNKAEEIYFELQSNLNERHAKAMARFVESRLKAGIDPEIVIEEFQEATAGTDMERGYVCLINQEDVVYLSHPSPEVKGMPVKPMALFDPNFTGEGQSPWQNHLRSGESNTGLLHLGENMPVEVVHFDALPDVNWTISSHENTARLQAEAAQLRKWLAWASILFGLLFAIPATVAARRVSGHYETQQQRQFELEQQFLQAEHDRKARELEEARAIQLSMLPASTPELSNVEVAFYMNPATEVGGDYYDYHIGEDGTLTLAIGDATGHGLQANTLVTATKSLFASLGERDDMAQILSQASATIKKIGLPKLYMAFALARISGNKLEIVGAGMPAALLYRASTQTIESLSLKGMPLGGFANFAYQTTTHEVAAGDTLLLMSDGFPEQFNADREMRGYDFAEEVLQQTCPASPDKIVAELKKALADWSQNQVQTDDVTFVVCKIK